MALIIMMDSFWASKKICLPLDIAASKALTDLLRPTNKGITMWDKQQHPVMVIQEFRLVWAVLNWIAWFRS